MIETNCLRELGELVLVWVGLSGVFLGGPGTGRQVWRSSMGSIEGFRGVKKVAPGDPNGYTLFR